mgnify:CR=1 FL=1
MKKVLKVGDMIPLKEGKAKITDLWKDGLGAFHVSYHLGQESVISSLVVFRGKMYFPTEEIILDPEKISQ